MKSKLHKIIVTVVLISASLVIRAFTIPDTYRYEKRVDIVAQQRMIFFFVAELKRWPEWSKFAKENTKYEYSEPSWGVGAKSIWTCKSIFGDGKVTHTVTQFNFDNLVQYDLTPEGGWETSHWMFNLKAAPRQGSTVTWVVEGNYPKSRFMRLIAYFMMWNLEHDLQKGLERLKSHAEKHEAYDVRGDWEPKPAPPPAPAPPTNPPRNPPRKSSSAKKPKSR